MFDLVIRGGTVVDGSGRPRFLADVAVQGDRIAVVGPIAADAPARRTLDAAGLVVAPGFIDVHNHSDGWMWKLGNLASKTAQGFTSEVLMSDGISYAPVSRENAREWIVYLRSLNGLALEDYRGWESIGDYLAVLDRNTAQNALCQIPFANLRVLACGWGRAPADDTQLKLMRRLVREGMEQGACGLSTGLDYVAQCFASTAEIVETCQPMAAQGGLYATHVRYKKGTLAGLREAVEIGRRAGVKVHISHLKLERPGQRDELLEFVDGVACREVDFSFDIYPYGPGSSMLNSLLPYEAWEEGPLGVAARLRSPELRRRFAALLTDYRLPLDRIRIAWISGQENAKRQGQWLSEYVAGGRRAPEDALADLLIEEQLATLLVFHTGDEAQVIPLLEHPRCICSTDGIYQPGGVVHPRQYGSAPRLLGPFVRDKRLFSLEDAVRKLSGWPAERFGLRDRGFVAEGRFADLVLFNPQTIADRATFDDPHQLPAGIPQVFVNGVAVIDAGRAIAFDAGAYPGRALRFQS